jgi:hypothetical protein
VGPVLFLLIGFSIWQQLNAQQDLARHWQSLKAHAEDRGLGWLALVVAGMALNWGLEGLKWHRLINHVMQASYGRAIMSVLAGVSFTMLTPNRMGEFLGRVLYLPDGSRVRAATLTLIGSMSQLIITMVLGCIGIIFLEWGSPAAAVWPSLLMNVLLYGTFLVLAGILVVYFNIGWAIRMVEKWPPATRYAGYIHAIGEIGSRELLKILGISALRYAVFLGQYWLVFRYLGIPLALTDMAAATAVMFLVLAVVPTISLAELGIRGKVSLFVYSLFVSDPLGILVTTAIIWLINIILPAFAGSLMLLSVRLFGKE